MGRDKPRAGLEGHFDGLLNDLLRGWVTNNGDLETPVGIDVFVDSSVYGTYTANIYREDLARANKGRGGRCAFEIEFDATALMTQLRKRQIKVEIYVAGTRGLKLGEQVFPGGVPRTFSISDNRWLLRRVRSVFDRRRLPERAVGPEQLLRKTSPDAKVFQFHSGSAVGDAVTNSLFYIQEILSDFQIKSEIFVQHRDPHLKHRLKLIEEFSPSEEDLLIIHHSMGHDAMPLLQSLKCRKILLYHNITPPTFFSADSPFRNYATLGLKQLTDLRNMIVGSIADSAYNAKELQRRGYKNVCVIPLLKEFAPLRQAEFNPTFHHFGEPRYQILFVGRICANKGQLNLINFMEQYADSFDYPLHLTLIGHFDHSEDYAAKLREAIEASALKDRIELVGHVSDLDLCGYYRAADVYVSYSEHEGFGVPLLEAMTFDLPVVALGSSAVAETLGSTGVKLKTTSPGELADVLHRLFGDHEYRRDLIRRQREHLRSFDRDVVSSKLLDFLRPHLPKGVRPLVNGKKKKNTDAQFSAVSRQYVLEGPCETTYSLAIVNRKLGMALSALTNTQVGLVPAEGVAGYVLDQEGLQRYPDLGSLLGMPKWNSRATMISIRNMYPLRPAGMLGDFRLAYFFWEESEVPSDLVRLINRYLDGIIAPTKFGHRVYRNSGIHIPIAVCGGGLESEAFCFTNESATCGMPMPFTFLHVSSGMPRKGIEELFSAYAAAFTRQENVELIVKTHDHCNNVVKSLYKKFFEGKTSAPAVSILFEDLTDDQMAELYRAADAIVLPTRGEGFNLPAAEALAMGIPVITTGYSGHLDFCNQENAILLDYDFELSDSHLTAGEAMWVRVRAVELAKKMRAVFDGSMKSEVDRKVANGLQTASELSWALTADKLSRFVDKLETGRKKMAKLRLAWVSTWNTRCGIASYSKYLISNLRKGFFDITIFANHLKDTHEDSPNVVRCWTDRSGSLEQLIKNIIDGGYDVAVFQYNFGFHTIEQLGDAVSRLEAAGIDTYVFFHKTAEADIDGLVESIAAAAPHLARATRLIVHAVEDVNRLKSYGLVDNVAKLPQGALSPPPMKRSVVRQFFDVDAYTPIVGCFGFLLPGKGLPELIFAFSMVLNKYPTALLLLLNSKFPSPVSDLERDKCTDIIQSLGLQRNVVLIDDYLDIDESMLLLNAADCVVFPYQKTRESSSAAVRQGISSLRPVLTTPLSIFEDVAEVVRFLPGRSPIDIANGIIHLLEDKEGQEHLAERQAKWLAEHSWSRIGERLSNMIVGIFEDRHEVSVNAFAAAAQPENVPAREDIMQQLMTEYQTAEFVRMAFFQILGKDANDQQLRRYVGLLREKQKTKSEVLAEICAMESAEDTIEQSLVVGGESRDGTKLNRWTVEFSEIDASDDEMFIRNVYYRFLMRAPHYSEFASLLHRLSSGSMTRRQVLDHILTSEEFVENDVPIRVTGLQKTGNAPP